MNPLTGDLMTSLHILLLTSGILGIFYLALSFAVIRQRFITKTLLGDGASHADKRGLLTAVRVHGNFAEYVPLALLLLGGMVAEGAGPRRIGLLCAALVLARLAHAIGMYIPKPNPWRAGGMMLNFTVLLTASIALILKAL